MAEGILMDSMIDNGMRLEEAALLVADGRTESIPVTDRSRVFGAFPAEDFRKMQDFCVEKSWSASGSVNILDVHGTEHPDYEGHSWEWLLQHGKRMSKNLALLRNNPSYYLDTDHKKPSMQFVRLNGTLYLGGDGNHRTCIAWHLFRLLGLTHIHGVEVQEYLVDMAAYGAWRRSVAVLEQRELYSVEVVPVCEKLGRDDSSGWQREVFKVGLKIVDRRSGTVVMAGAEDVEARLEEVIRPRGWLRFFR